MSGNTLIDEYNNIFARNYYQFISYAQQDKDLVHKSYLKIWQKFNSINFTGRTDNEIREKIFAYCKSSIYNTFLTQERLKKNQIEIQDCQNQLEEILQREAIINEDNRTETQQLEYMSEKLFLYLKLNYSEADNYVFRCYFLFEKDKRLTYAQLSKISGYSISKVCGIIQRMKADLRLNLINYINDK